MSCFWKSVNSEINTRQLQSEYSEVGFLLVADPMLPFFAIESVLPNSQTLGTDLVFWTVFFLHPCVGPKAASRNTSKHQVSMHQVAKFKQKLKFKNQMIQSSDIKWYQWAETAASSSYRQAGCVPLREGFRVRSLPNLWWMMATWPLALAKEPRVPLYLGTLLPYKIWQIPTTQTIETITISAVKASFFFGAVWVWFKQSQSGWGDVHPGDLQRNTPWANCATGHSFFTDPQDHRALPDFLVSVCLNDWLLTLGKRMQKVSAWGPPVSCFNFGDLFHIVDRNDDIVLMVAIVQTLQPT